jgi:hypothetical protein
VTGRKKGERGNAKKNILFSNLGEQHFHEFGFIFGLHGSLENYYLRDKQKQLECAKNGIKLVVVPYWWDGTKESLEDLILNSDDCNR